MGLVVFVVFVIALAVAVRRANRSGRRRELSPEQLARRKRHLVLGLFAAMTLAGVGTSIGLWQYSVNHDFASDAAGLSVNTSACDQFQLPSDLTNGCQNVATDIAQAQWAQNEAHGYRIGALIALGVTLGADIVLVLVVILSRMLAVPAPPAPSPAPPPEA